MHQAYNRDDFIKFNETYLRKASYGRHFTVFPKDTLDELNIPYDYQSVTHYSTKAFANENEFTIIPFDTRYLHTMGHMDTLSDIDVKKINIVYECQKVWDETLRQIEEAKKNKEQ